MTSKLGRPTVLNAATKITFMLEGLHLAFLNRCAMAAGISRSEVLRHILDRTLTTERTSTDDAV